ncbi:MAG: response regulator [Methyloceanibacter sp.]
MPAEPHARGRILVVEDEFLVAMVLEHDLRAVGYAIVGPFNSLTSAMEAMCVETYDLAILDINLNGEMVYPLAEELDTRGIPLIFLSGYGPAHFPERLRSLPRVSKPYDLRELVNRIAVCLGTSKRQR